MRNVPIRHSKLVGLVILIAVMASGCAAELVTSGDYRLRSGETLSGDLIFTSGNATLEEGSRVTGSVYVTSGNLNAYGEIDGDVAVTSGNVRFSSSTIVHGDVSRTGGNISGEEVADIKGRVSSGFSPSVFMMVIGRHVLLPLIVLGVLIYVVVDLSRRRRPAAKPAARAEAPPTPADPAQKLRQLEEMLGEGLITEDEYEAKKAEILSEM